MGITPFHGPPATPPVVPGFVPVTLLGAGGHGVVWSAREQISGDLVALKLGAARLGVPGDTASHEGDLLARVDHPHVIRLRRVVPASDGSTVLVLDLAAGGSLAALVAARGPLEPGEVVTLIVPLASALAELHAQGLVHGDLAPGNILFSADGRPMIGDLGTGSVLGARTGKEWSTPGFADPAHAGDPTAADVWGLGAVAWFALTGSPPSLAAGASGPADLIALLRSCLDPDPRRRPAMDEIALRAWDSATPVPIRFAGARGDSGSTGNVAMRFGGDAAGSGPSVDAPAGLEDDPAVSGAMGDVAAPQLWPAPDPSLRLTTLPSASAASSLAGVRPGRRRGQRPRLGVWHLVGAVAGCLASALAVFLLVPAPGGTEAVPTGARPSDAPAGSVTASTAPSASVAVTELSRALERAVQARASAFHLVSERALGQADEPGSDAYRQDRALIARLRAAGVRLDGVRYSIAGVQLAGPVGDVVDIDATVTTSAHRQVSTGTGETTAIAATGPSAVRLRLVRSGDTWLVRSVRPRPDSATSAAPG